jgi:Uma2 family endonuclease
MSAVSTAEAWPHSGRPFTVEDLDLLPDDGHRCELLDGSLVVSPRPGMPHQVVAGELFHVLRLACPTGLRVVPEPAIPLSGDTEFVPDIAVVREDQIGGMKCTKPPLLVVEVRSSSTALIDLNRKKTAYERFGVSSYWIMVPDATSPELIAFELRDGRYAEAGQAAGDGALSAVRPFPVEVVPARLVAGLPAA